MSSTLGIVAFVASIVLAIVIHEAGHLVSAKLSGIRADRFFVGFGPTLWSTRRGETEYGLKAVLLGGYVRIVGMGGDDEDMQLPLVDELPTVTDAEDARRWWPALELLLGARRWSIIVGSDDYHAALEVARRTAPGREAEALVNPLEVLSPRLAREVQDGSLAARVEVTHPLARAYADHLLGDVLCV